MKYVVDKPDTAGSVMTCVDALAGMLRLDAEVAAAGLVVPVVEVPVHGRPDAVQHPEDRPERLRELVRAPGLEERARVLVVLELGLARVVGRARRRAVPVVHAVREPVDVVEDALRLPRVVVPDGPDRPQVRGGG